MDAVAKLNTHCIQQISNTQEITEKKQTEMTPLFRKIYLNEFGNSMNSIRSDNAQAHKQTRIAEEVIN